MSNADIVVGRDGWNGWAVHVSEFVHPIGTELQPWSIRLTQASRELSAFNAVYPLNEPAKLRAYWRDVVEPTPQPQRAPFHAWTREAALETARVEHYPKLISRLNSIFGFRCFADAIRFACHHRPGPNSHLYEFQPGGNVLLADMKVWDACQWDYLKPDEAFRVLTLMATDYWSGATDNPGAVGMSRPELLVPSPVTVEEAAIPFERER